MTPVARHTPTARPNTPSRWPRICELVDSLKDFSRRLATAEEEVVQVGKQQSHWLKPVTGKKKTWIQEKTYEYIWMLVGTGSS